MKKGIVNTHVRLPVAIARGVERSAKVNRRSINQEIVTMLEAALSRSGRGLVPVRPPMTP